MNLGRLFGAVLVLLFFSYALSPVRGLTEPLSSITYSPDSELIAFSYGISDRPVLVFDDRSGETKAILPVKGVVTSLDFSPDVKLLAASLVLSYEPSHGEIRVWNTHDGTLVAAHSAPAVYFVRFLGRNVVAFNYLSRVHSWQIEGTETDMHRGYNEVSHVSFFRNASTAVHSGRNLLAATDGRRNTPVIIMNTSTGRELARLEVRGIAKRAFFNESGDKLCVLSDQSETPIALYETQSWKLVRTLPITGKAKSGAFSPDDRLLAVHFGDTITEFDLETGGVRHRYSPFTEEAEHLREAVADGDLAAVETLVSSCSVVDVGDPDTGLTPLMIASQTGRVDIVSVLLKAGANVNAVASLDFDALTLAAWFGNTDVVELLIQAGAGVNAHNGQALWFASGAGRLAPVRALIKHGANVNLTPSDTTPLMEACSRGNVEEVRLLLESGARVRAVSATGNTARSLTIDSRNQMGETAFRAIIQLLNRYEKNKTP